MNTQLMTRRNGCGQAAQSRRGRASRASHVTLPRRQRAATRRALHALIAAHLAEGRLLPRRT